MIDMNHDLDRFLDAQNAKMMNGKTMFEVSCEELKAGQKSNHWIYFVFPILKSMALDETSSYYGLKNIDEARQYLDHPILYERLMVSTNLLIQLKKPISEVMSEIDVQKVFNSMALFDCASGNDFNIFKAAFIQLKCMEMMRY